MAISDLYKNSSPVVTNPPSPGANNLLAAAWLVGGALTILGPLIYRTVKIGNYQNLFEMYNWEEAQQNQYYNQDNYQYQWEQMRGSYDINQCKWWQLNCFPYYINENGEPEPMAGWYPSWFSGWAQTEEEREQMMEDGETSSAIIFTYVWQIIMFIVILTYGFIVIKQNRIVTGVTVALVVFANMAFLALWMLADGSIITDGEYIEKVGFYGQFPVLMFMTNAWYFVFGIVFAAIFAIRGHSMHATPEKDTVQDTASNYKVMDSPEKQNAPPLV